MPEELENGTKLGAEDNQSKSSVGWDQKETKRAWLTERPLACKGVLEHKWQVKALASRWGEATSHAWGATESSCPRSQDVVAEARRQAGALVTGWYLSREWFEGEWRKIPDPWTPHRPCLSMIVETSDGTIIVAEDRDTMTAVCLASDTPAAESHTRPVAYYFNRGACQPDDPPGVFTQGSCRTFFV